MPRWALAVLLGFAAVAVYWPTTGHPFILFDDPRYVTENPDVLRGLGWDGVAWAFQTFHAANWHPITWLSHMADVTLFGPVPGSHHLVNVLLHAANAILLFLLLARATGADGRSAFVAALFALHPTHVESVAWIAERKDLLSTAFGLLALLAYVSWTRRGGALRYALVAACFALSLLSKPMWVTLPFLLLLLDAWPLERLGGAPHGSGSAVAPATPRRLVVEKLPLLALSVASSAVTVAAQSGAGAVRGQELGLPARLANAAVAYVRYAGKTLWPSDLAVFYPLPVSGTPAWKAIGALAILALVTAYAIRERRSMPWVAVGWSWFLGTLVPVIGLVQVGSQAMADRYTYLPTIGLYVAITWTAASIAARAGRIRLLAVAGAAVLLGLAWRTHVQVGHWSSHEALFRHSILVEPDGALAHGALSEGLRRDGRLDEALLEALEATRLEPGHARHWHNLGITYRSLGRPGDARDAFAEAVRVDPAYLPGWALLGQAELDLGRPDAALAAYEQAMARGSESAQVWTGAAILYQASGRTADAGRAFEAVTRIDPGSVLAWRNLGVWWARSGNPVEAERAFLRALSIDPGNVDVRQRLEAIRSGVR